MGDIHETKALPSKGMAASSISFMTSVDAVKCNNNSNNNNSS